MVVIVMGVSGSGKSSVGRSVAQRLGWAFVEADEFHSPSNVDKMLRAVPLTDADRAPWLADLRNRIQQSLAAGQNTVIACSALKRAYRDTLVGADADRLALVHLSGPSELIAARLTSRRGHFMPPSLLASQFEALEPPGNTEAVFNQGRVLTLDVCRPLNTLVDSAALWLAEVSKRSTA